MPDTILVVNVGSSSLKFAIFELAPDGALTADCRGKLTGIGTQPRLRIFGRDGTELVDTALGPEEIPDVPSAVARVDRWLSERFDGSLPVAVGHRIVHGGTVFTAPVAIDEPVLADLERLTALAPLHQPGNLHAVRALRRSYPDLLQVACFDTAFHRNHPEVADRYALPDAYYRAGVRRYGFHGLSYEYIVSALPEVAPGIARGKIVVAHLGNGASMCAIEGGRSIETTMGFSVLDGLPMGSRCGRIDPGVLLYLLSTEGFDAQSLERLLYHESGLKGLSGISSDVRDLLASEAPAAGLALDYFVHRVACELGALAGAMGGIDALVFTAGIGEHSAQLRARICERARWLGLRLDPEANAAGGPCISTPDARVSAWAIPTSEERVIAEHTLTVWRAARGESRP